MAEFVVGGHTYRSGQMDAFIQLKIVKRALPLMNSFTAIAKNADPNSTVKTDPKVLIGNIMSALSQMSDEDVDYITQSCLNVTKRVEVNVLADVWNARAKKLQYSISVIEILQITVNVIVDNIGSFSPALAGLGSLAGAVPGLSPSQGTTEQTG